MADRIRDAIIAAAVVIARGVTYVAAICASFIGLIWLSEEVAKPFFHRHPTLDLAGKIALVALFVTSGCVAFGLAVRDEMRERAARDGGSR